MPPQVTKDRDPSETYLIVSGRRREHAKAAGVSAAELTNKPPVTIGPEDTVAGAAKVKNPVMTRCYPGNALPLSRWPGPQVHDGPWTDLVAGN